MSRRRAGKTCCCNIPGCTIVADNFDRDNSTNLGSKWAEVLEDSEIVDNELQIPAGGIVATTAKHFHRTCDAWVTIPDPQPGDVYYILVNYLDDDNYLYAKFTAAGGGVAELVAGSCSGGAETDLDAIAITYTAGYPLILEACRGIDNIHAATDSYLTHCWGKVPTDNGGRKAGLRNGSAGAVTFDDFVYSEHNYTDSDCPCCHCTCADWWIPSDQILLTFRASGCPPCEAINWATIILTVDDGKECIFRGEASLPSVQCDPDNPFDYIFAFHTGCSGDAGDLWLCDGAFIGSEGWEELCNATEIVDWPGAHPSSHTCSPFLLTFGPFITYGPGSEVICTYYIDLTAVP